MSNREHHFGYWEALQKEIGFSQAVRVGNMVYIAGSAPLNADFTPAHVGDFDGQIRFAYERIDETLKHFGLAFGDVVREVMYVTDIDALMRANPIRKSFYGSGPYPASTAVEVRRLVLPEVMVEIEITAALPA